MLPTIEGVIARRLLINYRVDPAQVAVELPGGLRPQTVNGHAIVGICLIRLQHLRPAKLPAVFGVASQNAAHRIAVEWNEGTEVQHGVYIPRRDTSSRLNALLGGRLFPGVHHRAAFRCSEHDDHVEVRMRSLDREVDVAVQGQVTDRLPDTSAFDDVDHVSAFFAKDTIGLSPRSDGSLEGLELEAFTWAVTPLRINFAYSTYIEHEFGCRAAFDSALLMRGIRHRWHQHALGDTTSRVGG